MLTSAKYVTTSCMSVASVNFLLDTKSENGIKKTSRLLVTMHWQSIYALKPSAVKFYKDTCNHNPTLHKVP